MCGGALRGLLLSDLLSPVVGGAQPVPAIGMVLIGLLVWGRAGPTFQSTWSVPGVRGVS